MKKKCRLVEQGFGPGSCLTWHNGKTGLACKLTLRWENGIPYRLIKSAHLSRPEHYFSIYQSGCNFSFKKCHSWQFTQYAEGEWMSPDDIANLTKEYAKTVTYKEPRERATSFHALDLCKCCGQCVEVRYLSLVKMGKLVHKPFLVKTGKRSKQCPKKIKPEQIVLSPQGFGPARKRY